MKKVACLLALAFFWLATNPSFAVAVAAMNDYCVNPVASTTPTKPNILIVMDHSGSMQFPAYIKCDFVGYWSSRVAACTPVDDGSNYNATQSYYGLFDKDQYYKYASNMFQKTSCSATNKIGWADCISGNLLNWITTTRIDAARKVLTGGRTNSGTADRFESEGGAFYASGNENEWYRDSGLGCRFYISAGTTANRKLSIENRSGYTCPIGTLSDATINVKLESADEATGVIQDFFDKASFEFMAYSTGDGTYDREGEMKSSKDATQTSLVNAINNETPYWGTPTGKALWEAYDFFKQSNDHDYEANTSDINSGNGTKDPWYDGTGSATKAIPCRKSFVLLLSDGAWNDGPDPVIPARTMRISDLRNLSGTQNVTTYVIYAFGDSNPDTKKQGRNAMINTAIFGGFDFTSTDTWPYPYTGYTPGMTSDCGSDYDSSRESDITIEGSTTSFCNSRAFPNPAATAPADTFPIAACNPNATWNASCKEWDKDKKGLPYNFFEADNGEKLKTSLIDALSDMLRRASSGTAASVLASSEGSGANILQSVFYPRRLFGDTEISWIGEMQNLWYYIDPYLSNSSIREDTISDDVLNPEDDRKIEFFFDTDYNKTKVRKYSADGSSYSTIELEEIKNLWEAGSLLFQRDPTTRTIYTKYTTTPKVFDDFSTATSSDLYQYLQAADTTEAGTIINYVRGTDQTGYRNRKVTIGTTNAEWKLGDIVSSTPKIQSAVSLNTYHSAPPDGYSDATYYEFIRDSNNYLKRGMSYVGANDGMLHAFKFGTLQETWDSQGANDKARLSNLVTTGVALGEEAWAFIPKNALPYLKYLMDKNYNHIHFVDLPPLIVDASVGADPSAEKSKDSWKTILIGGMGIGGANKNSSDSCTPGAIGTCVKTPISNVGYSSYFALDVTDPTSPKFLWEFSNSDLGFSTSGPAIIRIGDPLKNGKWFVVFASGPTGPINTTYHQFLGKSDQHLRLFVLDLATGTLERTIDTELPDAFGSSLSGAVIDVDRGAPGSTGRYSDDVLYVGYTQKDTNSPATWTKGGVLRLSTHQNDTPANWTYSLLISDIGPVTSSVAKLQDRKGAGGNGALWIYFGTGRFFYRYEDTIDDPHGHGVLYGIMDPCYGGSGHANIFNASCTESVTTGQLDLQDDDNLSSSLSDDKIGWYIPLDPQSGDNGGERVITDPLAVFSGAVFFTTYAPSSDVCSLGGNTYIWAVKYNSGAAIPQSGRAVIQTSTGAIQGLDLSSAFGSHRSRRTAAIIGMPPKGQGLSVIIPPRPLKKFLHIRAK